MAASEKQLGVLHEAIAVYLTDRVTAAQADLNNDKVEPEAKRLVSAAELGVAVALLKNSNITSKKERGSALSELENVLSAKGKGIAPTSSDLEDALANLQYSTQAH